METRGSCLCGGITLRIDGELAGIQVCHCSQCRKAQGVAFASNIPVREAALVLRDDERLLRGYESSPGKQRLFCSRCGSPVMSRLAALPGVVRVRAGLLDEPVASAPVFHAFVGSKAGWWSLDDGLPQHPGAVPPSPTAASV